MGAYFFLKIQNVLFTAPLERILPLYLSLLDKWVFNVIIQQVPTTKSLRTQITQIHEVDSYEAMKGFCFIDPKLQKIR